MKYFAANLRHNHGSERNHAAGIDNMDVSKNLM